MIDLQQLLDAQLDLQSLMPPRGRDVTDLDDDTRAEFIRWNVLALEDELHEALNECGWKPWATSRHLNRDAYMSELVDAFHFFMNLMLAARITADEFAVVYFAKRDKNAQRQRDGYDGLNKCSSCRRALDDIVPDVRADGAYCPCGTKLP